MKHRIGFAGFRHPHIFALWKAASLEPRCEISGALEVDPSTRRELEVAGEVGPQVADFEELLASSDIVAIGDVFARRGQLAIAALEAGKHVISDKPLCTERAELEIITRLALGKGLRVGCQFDLIESGTMRTLRHAIRTGEIGQVCTITISAQHPLRFGSRAAWYFEPGMHGGTINDIGGHIFHLVPWLTGLSWENVLAAREWNAKAAVVPHFNDCAQFYAALGSGAACFADVSYLAPDHLGYELPQYWRITLHGTGGMAEASYSREEVVVIRNDDQTPSMPAPLPGEGGRHLRDFLDEIEGFPSPDGLTTERVLEASRWALETQLYAGTFSPNSASF